MTLYIIFCLLLLAVLPVLLAPVVKAGGMPQNRRTGFIVIVSVFFFTASFGLYSLWGSPEIIPLLAKHQEELAKLQQSITTYSAAVKTNPKDLKAWVELGQDFMETRRFSAAANALREAVVLSRGSPVLIMAYAQAQIFAAGGKITDDAKKALEMVLLQQPDNPQARYYLAVRQLQDGNTQEAMKEMKALYQSLPADSPVKKMIDEEIGK